MRKFLLPVINLVNLILISIVWGISNKSGAVYDAARGDLHCGTFYDIVWSGKSANVVGIIGFFLFCVACLITLFAFLPVKVRKFVAAVGGAMYIGAGVLFLLAPKPKFYDYAIIEPKLSGSLITMAVLVFIVGAFTLAMAALEFTAKEEK